MQLEDIVSALQQIESLMDEPMGESAEAEGLSDKLQTFELRLADLKNILPQVFKNVPLPAQEKTEVIVSDLYGQLVKGKVETTAAYLLAGVPRKYLNDDVDLESKQMVSLPLPLVVSAVSADELKKRTASVKLDMGLQAIPDLFAGAGASGGLMTPATAAKAAAVPPGVPVVTLRIADIQKLLPTSFGDSDFKPAEVVNIRVDDLYEQLSKGKVAVKTSAVLAMVPEQYLSRTADRKSNNPVTLPLPMVVGGISPDELKKRTTMVEKQDELLSLPNLFEFQDGAKPPPPKEVRPEGVKPAGEAAPTAKAPGFDPKTWVEERLKAIAQKAGQAQDITIPEILPAAGAPAKSVEAVRTAPPVAAKPAAPVAPVAPAAAPKPPEPVKSHLSMRPLGPSAPLAPPNPIESVRPPMAMKPPAAPQPVAPRKPVEPVKPPEPVKAAKETLAAPPKIGASQIVPPPAPIPVKPAAPVTPRPMEPVKAAVPKPAPAPAIPPKASETVHAEPAVRTLRPSPQSVAPAPVPPPPASVTPLVPDLEPAVSRERRAKPPPRVEHIAPPILMLAGVDLNMATPEQLERVLEGIGPQLAQRIVDDRNTSGPFFDYYDLSRVPGIGRRIYERITGKLWREENYGQLTIVNNLLERADGKLPNLNDVAQRFKMLPGFEGCAIMHRDGFLLANSWDDAHTDDLQAMAPQIVKRVTHYMRRVSDGEVASVSVNLVGRSITFVLNEDICFVAVHGPRGISRKHMQIVNGLGVALGRRFSGAEE